MSIHQMALAASQASLKTECTIWPVSKPRELRLLSSSRSNFVPNMMGAGVFKSDAKFWGGNEGRGCSAGDEGSERFEDTERRLVRTGVRVGNAGGSLFLGDRGVKDGWVTDSGEFSSITVSGCDCLFPSLWTALRIVD